MVGNTIDGGSGQRELRRRRDCRPLCKRPGRNRSFHHTQHLTRSLQRKSTKRAVTRRSASSQAPTVMPFGFAYVQRHDINQLGEKSIDYQEDKVLILPCGGYLPRARPCFKSEAMRATVSSISRHYCIHIPPLSTLSPSNLGGYLHQQDCC